MQKNTSAMARQCTSAASDMKTAYRPEFRATPVVESRRPIASIPHMTKVASSIGLASDMERDAKKVELEPAVYPNSAVVAGSPPLLEKARRAHTTIFFLLCGDTASLWQGDVCVPYEELTQLTKNPSHEARSTRLLQRLHSLQLRVADCLCSQACLAKGRGRTTRSCRGEIIIQCLVLLDIGRAPVTQRATALVV